MTTELTVILHGVNPADLSRNIQFKTTTALPKRARVAQKRVAELVERAVREQDYHPGRKVVAMLEFPFRSKNSDVDGPIKRTIDGVQMGIRAAREHDTPPWNDKAVEIVSAARVAKHLPMRIVLRNLPEEG
jgi:hypothetical protein